MTEAAERRALLADVPPDTWLARHWDDDGPNVQGVERWLSIAGGVGIAAVLGRRRDLPGALGALLGAGLVIRGLTGRCPAKRALQSEHAGDNPKRTIAKAHGWSSAALIHGATGVNKPRQACYDTWRDFSNLGRFMENVVSVEVLDDTRSHWTVKAPLGRTVEWDALVTEDVPGERIAWETAPGADIKSAGWVEFKDAIGGGTEVRARFAYAPPAGRAGQVAAKVLQREPTVQARRDLRRFKMFMETGEIAVSHVPGQPATAADLRL